MFGKLIWELHIDGISHFVARCTYQITIQVTPSFRLRNNDRSISVPHAPIEVVVRSISVSISHYHISLTFLRGREQVDLFNFWFVDIFSEA